MIWWVMVAVGLGTFLLRFSFVGGMGQREVHPGFLRMLRFVPPAVLAALVCSSLLPPAGTPVAFDSRWVAAVVAAAVAWRTRNVLLTIAVGMAVLWTLQALIGAGVAR